LDNSTAKKEKAERKCQAFDEQLSNFIGMSCRLC